MGFQKRTISVHFRDIHDLPVLSRLYRALKANPKTDWLASALASRIFLNLLKVLVLIAYFVVGVCYYCPKEGWGVGSAIFFTISTLTTIGYGYHHPRDDSSRIFTIFFIVAGAYFVFLFVTNTVIRGTAIVVKYFENKFEQKKDLATEYKNLNRLIYINFGAIFVLLFIGTGALMVTEGWTFATALYFAVQTSTTVAYGDVPIYNKDETYPFLCVYMILSTVLLALFINNLSNAESKKRQIRKMSELLLQNKDASFLAELDPDRKGISEPLFLLSVLLKLRVINEEHDLAHWREIILKKFRSLAGDKDVISNEDIEAFRGTDVLGSEVQVQEYMRVSGLALDYMEAQSFRQSLRPFASPSTPCDASTPNPIRKKSLSFDLGVQIQHTPDKSAEERKTASMRHSDLGRY